ncbi:MAG TPA: FecR domain-containing protein [Steroidobacteraceae bacterium]|nr:FecR domain-containing protein [Steroidobacteraceae bacterium]
MKESGDVRFTDVHRWEEALTWYSTLSEAEQRDLSAAVGCEWQRWYADAENRRLFDEVSRLLGDRDRYARRQRPKKADLDNDPYVPSMAVADWQRIQAPPRVLKQRSLPAEWSWWLTGGIGAAVMATLIAIWALQSGTGGAPTRAVVYQTEIGGVQSVRLSDGSNIILGARTKLAVEFSAERRSISLIEGQAWFKVAHDPHWPFIVAAGDGTITDIGTAFMVTRESDRVVVAVTEGAVEVSAKPSKLYPLRVEQELASRPALAPIRVSRGEELALGDNGTLDRIKPTDTYAATTWTHGTLTFDNQPLRYVIEAVDRYSKRHIVVSPSASTLRFSGIVHSDEIEDWLQSLEVIFPVTVQEYGANVSIDTRLSTPAPRELRLQTQP